VHASSFPKELTSHALFAGFKASELRTALRLTTVDLCDAGFAAVDIAASLGSMPPSQATLKELAEAGLALELAASPEVDIQDLRKAGCADVPTYDQMDRAVDKVSSLPSVESLKKVTGMIDGSNKGLSDADGAALIWALAINCGAALTEFSLSRNKLGNQTAVALAQYLRFNSSLISADLHDNMVGDIGALALAKGLPCNATLQTLRLSKNEITLTGSIGVFEGLTRNHAVKHVTMETAGGVMSPGIDIHRLKGVVPADVIDFSSRHLGPLSAAIIAKLIERYRPQLHSLEIDKNAILKEGAKYIAEMLKTNDEIKTLDVRFCSLGPEGMAALVEALQVNTSVDRLLAISNHLGSKGAEVFHGALLPTSSLRFITLQDNLIPPEAMAALRDAAAKVPGLQLNL